MNLSTIAIVCGVVFIAELPDKSMFATLALSLRYRKMYVWVGVAAAFLVHVIIAVTAGHFLTLLPKQLLEFIVAGLFLLGAGLLLFGNDEDGAEEVKEVGNETKQALRRSSEFWKVFATSFGVVFLGEWGDITQIAVANYAANYHDTWSVAIGATIGLWSVSALGIYAGSKLLKRIPARLVQRITGLILLGFAIVTVITALR